MGSRIVAAAVGRPRRALAAALVVAVVAGLAASRLEPSAPPSLLAQHGSAVAAATRGRALGPLRKQYEQLFVRFGYLGPPSLVNRTFVQALVLSAGPEPKKRFAWLFPDRRHALVLVRLRDDLSDARVRAIGREVQGIVS